MSVAARGGQHGLAGRSGPEAARLDRAFVAAATGGTWERGGAGPWKELAGVGSDTRGELAGRLFVALRGERHDGHDHLKAAASAGAVAALVDRRPRDPRGLDLLRVEDTLVALQRLAAAWRRRLDVATVGVTGSAGKTTTRRLVHAALAAAHPGVQSPKSFNNHIGVPLTLLAATARHRFVVAEIGMNAPGEIADLTAIAAPEVGIVVSVGHAHLEGVGSLEGVAREKAALLRGLRRDSAVAPLAIVNADSPALLAQRAGLDPGIEVLRFGRVADADLRLVARRATDEGQVIEILGPGARRMELALRLPGAHNAMNALAAVAAARHLGVDDRSIAAGLSEVFPSDMRFAPRLLGGDGGAPPVRLIDDAYNANPESMAAALATFGEVAAAAPRRLVVLGDMRELGPASAALHAALAAPLGALDAVAPLAEVILVGEQMAHAAAALAAVGRRATHLARLDDDGLAGIVALVRPGDALLVKASRGMALERVGEALARHFGGEAPRPDAR